MGSKASREKKRQGKSAEAVNITPQADRKPKDGKAKRECPKETDVVTGWQKFKNGFTNVARFLSPFAGMIDDAVNGPMPDCDPSLFETLGLKDIFGDNKIMFFAIAGVVALILLKIVIFR